MFMNDSITDKEQAEMAIWDYPIDDKYIQMYKQMQNIEMSKTLEDAVERVRRSPSDTGTIHMIYHNKGIMAYNHLCTADLFVTDLIFIN